MNEKLKVKWSTLVKIITIIVFVILLVADYNLVKSFLHSKDIVSLIIAIGIFLMTLYFALQTPRFLELNDRQLIVHKVLGKLSFDFNQIALIELYKPDRSEIRLLGSGGMFGYLGKFKNATIGNYQACVSDYAQAFLVQTKSGKNYVFSCEKRDLVINTIKKHLQ